MRAKSKRYLILKTFQETKRRFKNLDFRMKPIFKFIYKNQTTVKRIPLLVI